MTAASSFDARLAFDDLLQDFDLRDEAGLTVLGYASDLLVLIHEAAPADQEWDSIESGAVTRKIDDLRDRFVDVIGAAHGDDLASSWVRIPLRSAIREVIAAEGAPWVNAPNLHVCVVAHALAAALGETGRDTLLSEQRGRNIERLEPGRAYPRLGHDRAPWIATLQPRLNSRADAHPTRDLTITPTLHHYADSTYRFDVSFAVFQRLQGLGRHTTTDGSKYQELRLAAAQPNADLADWDVNWTPKGDRHDPPFYSNLGPLDSARQASLVLQQIQYAGENDVDILVFPEYTLDEDARDLVLAEIGELSARPRLVVAGLSHVDPSTGRQSAAWRAAGAVGDGGANCSELPGKYSGAPIKCLVGCPIHVAGGVLHEEDIRPGGSIEVFATDTLTLAVLVCRDVLEPALRRALVRIGVDLVVIPSMSPKTTSMVGGLRTLATDGQVLSLLGNGPAIWTTDAEPVGRFDPLRVEAAFDGPYADHLAPHLAPARGADAPERFEPGMWILESHTRRWTWHSVGP